MDNSSFAPNALSSSSTLMRLASSAEAHETPQLAAPPHPHPSSHPHPFSSAPSLDKEHAVPFSNSGFVYHHPHSLMSSSLYPPLPPFPRPSLEQGMGLIGHSSSGAFQPLGGPHEGAEPYHSAFTHAKLKPDDASCSSTFTSENNHQPSLDKDVEGSKSDSPLFSAKEERLEGISSVDGDANSEVHSDNGEVFERGTPDSEGRSLRKSRKRAMDGHLPCCPVCGLTLHPGETEAHLAQEQEKLDRIFRGGRKSRDSTPSGKKTLTSPPARKGKDSPSPEAAAKTRYESYLQIRSNRQTRLNARSRNKKRRVGEELVCPVCSERMTCTAEELTVHVDLCLKKQKQGEEEEEEALVDVEGDGGGDQFEEYTWAGQTRVRASSMLERGFAGFGFQTSSRRMSDEEGELDVDGDDTELYGKPQFTEEDLIPVGSSGESFENLEHQGARETIALSAQCEAVRGEPKPSTSRARTSQDDSQSNGDASSSCGEGAVVAALKARLKDLEGSRDTRQKCLICLNHYQEPLVSVLCWHVHCRECWCQTLGAKKLCPQCNMITCMPNLRRIYL